MLSGAELSLIESLTKTELLDELRRQMPNARWSRISKPDIIKLLGEQERTVVSAVLSRAEAKQANDDRNRRKRRTEQQRDRRNAKRHCVEEDSTPRPFLTLPSQAEVNRAHKAFLEATSNAALRRLVCVSCAREMSSLLGKKVFLDSLSHPERLIPKVPHPAHETINSMLLVTEKVSSVDGRQEGWFCLDCLHAIDSNRLPPLALANRMWIGCIPEELSQLTVPEQILVSLYHPRCYIYKLYPRDLWSNGAGTASLQNGLKGNVTTYELNMPDIVRMLEGKLMPRPTSILASVIAVSFIGTGQVPKTWLKKTFRVRRAVVLAALRCLKETTCHPGYRDLEISSEAVAQLPEDDVPDEILAAIQYEPNVEKAQKEAESYLQNEHNESVSGPNTGSSSNSSNSQVRDQFENQNPSSIHDLDDNVPDAIPLQYLGAVDTDISKLSTEELLLHGLANADGRASGEGGYAVRHGKTPVSDFGRTKPSGNGPSAFTAKNYSVYAFPCLYPYGEGGIEAEREVPVSLQDHIRANLHYWDRRFRRHPSWPFVFFGLLQKRQALMSSRVQMRRKDFEKATRLFAELTPDDLAAAAEAESKGRAITNPKILLLRRLIHCAGAKVMGSDASRASYRSQIWSTMLYKNPPSLWITINPNDLHDPIVQVLFGEEIDMDSFSATAGPDRQQRAENIAKDPYASAEFFHFLISLILKKLFGIGANGRRVSTTTGILGRVSAYYGVVEAQGRGSLHLHMVVWLENAPSSDTMQTLLKDEDFRQRVAKYVDANIRAHLDGLNAETVKEIEKDPELAWSRPPDPDSPSYEREFATRELHFVRAQQVHACKKTTCLVYQHDTKEWVCKRRAPFPVTESTLVSEDGEILPKRTFGYLNNWNPSILVYVGCNNDIKFISNGAEARAVIWYITAYQTKKQQRSHNLSALLAEGLAYHFNSSDYIDDVRERNRLLVFRCLRVLNRQMEQSAPQVMSYLLGYGDKFCSHGYVPLHWSSVAAEIVRAFPNIKKADCVTLEEPVPDVVTTQPEINTWNDTNEDGGSNSEDSDSESETDDEEHVEQVVIETLPSGVLAFRSQLTDYKLRGHEFEDMNFLQFAVDTWEAPYSAKSEDNRIKTTAPRVGAPRHARARYLPNHPRANTHERVLRADGHNMLPNIVGPYLPRSDVESSYNFYCASILSLLRPWREISDLLIPGHSWSVSFGSFLLSATARDLDFMSAAQYYYECKDAAGRDRERTSPVTRHHTIPTGSTDTNYDSEDEELDEHSLSFIIQPPRTEAELEQRLEELQNPRELKHGTDAVKIASQAGLFGRDIGLRWKVKGVHLQAATTKDLEDISKWREAMQRDVNARRELAPGTLETSVIVEAPRDVGSVVPSYTLKNSVAQGTSEGIVIPEPVVEERIDPVDISHLTDDQSRAYRIIQGHFNETLAGRAPRQLLMQIQGEGGTGKSTVISCVAELFEKQKAAHKLLRSAYTGIAASLINGNTLHTLCQLSSRRTEPNATVLQKLRDTWAGVEYLIIDEISMVSRQLLARISTTLGRAKQSSDDDSVNADVFGGLNVILTGDFHQFPPVACALSAALYWPVTFQDGEESSMGGKVYRWFQTVVILQKQYRTTDKTWLDVLQHVRHGTCTARHLEIIRSLIISVDPNHPERLGPEWENAVLVTPRHAVRLAWNKMAARRHCAKHSTRLYICPAEDTLDNRPLTISERWQAGKKKARKKVDRGKKTKGNLPDTVELAVGMEVMVTYNVQTELDVANGARGVVERIILDRRETITDDESMENSAEVKLIYPPECVLVRLHRTKAAQIPGLEPSVVPIVPMARKYSLPRKGGKSRQVTRRQLPITAAYAFTDYRSQGQTIKRVIVDIARPPSGGLTPFNAYVALSRSSGRDTIRLLRDFDDELFQQTPSTMLEAEDRRLMALNEKTKSKWEQGECMWGHGVSTGLEGNEFISA